MIGVCRIISFIISGRNRRALFIYDLNISSLSASDLSPAERGSLHQLQKRQRPHGHVGDPGAVPDPAARARHGAAGLHAGPRLYAQVGRPHSTWRKKKIIPGQKKVMQNFVLPEWELRDPHSCLLLPAGSKIWIFFIWLLYEPTIWQYFTVKIIVFF